MMVNIQNTTKGNINKKIKETQILVDKCRNPAIMSTLNKNMTCYLAIKVLLEREDQRGWGLYDPALTLQQRIGEVGLSRGTHNPEIAGSSPVSATILFIEAVVSLHMIAQGS